MNYVAGFCRPRARCEDLQTAASLNSILPQARWLVLPKPRRYPAYLAGLSAAEVQQAVHRDKCVATEQPAAVHSHAATYRRGSCKTGRETTAPRRAQCRKPRGLCKLRSARCVDGVVDAGSSYRCETGWPATDDVCAFIRATAQMPRPDTRGRSGPQRPRLASRSSARRLRRQR